MIGTMTKLRLLQFGLINKCFKGSKKKINIKWSTMVEFEFVTCFAMVTGLKTKILILHNTSRLLRNKWVSLYKNRSYRFVGTFGDTKCHVHLFLFYFIGFTQNSACNTAK